MGATIWLLIIYAILIVLDIIAFVKGRQNKKWIPFMVLTIVIILGIVVLGYLWIRSPM